MCSAPDWLSLVYGRKLKSTTLTAISTVQTLAPNDVKSQYGGTHVRDILASVLYSAHLYHLFIHLSVYSDNPDDIRIISNIAEPLPEPQKALFNCSTGLVELQIN